MKLSRIVSIVFSIIAFAVTESALAVCSSPLPSGVYCCTYVSQMHPAGGITGVGPISVNATSLANCRAIAVPVFNALASTRGCELPAFNTVISEPWASPELGYTWRQSFYDQYYTPPGASHPQICAHLEGWVDWNAASPPPPPPPPTVSCTVPDMPGLPTADTCTNSLEANNGLPGSTSGCPAVPVMTRASGEPCFSGKLNTIGVAYNGPTSTIRTTTYNQHLLTVWTYHLKHRFISDPAEWQACATKRAIVETEMRKHGLIQEPAPNSRHLAGRAFDTSRTVIAGIQRIERIPAMLRRATACTLNWGGTWKGNHFDPVHFELNVP